MFLIQRLTYEQPQYQGAKCAGRNRACNKSALLPQQLAGLDDAWEPKWRPRCALVSLCQLVLVPAFPLFIRYSGFHPPEQAGPVDRCQDCGKGVFEGIGAGSPCRLGPLEAEREGDFLALVLNCQDDPVVRNVPGGSGKVPPMKTGNHARLPSLAQEEQSFPVHEERKELWQASHFRTTEHFRPESAESRQKVFTSPPLEDRILV